MSRQTSVHRFALYGSALLILTLLMTLAPFLVQSQPGPTPTPTATSEAEFRQECLRQLNEVLHFQAEVDAGRQDPDLHLDDAKKNYENYGCTWDMFIPTVTPTLSGTPIGVTPTGVTPIPTSTPGATPVDPAFYAECLRQALEIAHFQREVDAGNQRPDKHLDDAVNNFVAYGCTSDMFNLTPTPAPSVTHAVAALQITATPTPATTGVDPAFYAECLRQALEIAHFQREVDAGNQRPDKHLDDAVNNFVAYGCHSDMFG